MDEWTLAQHALQTCGSMDADQLRPLALTALQLFSQGLIEPWQFIRGFVKGADASEHMGVIGHCIVQNFKGVSFDSL